MTSSPLVQQKNTLGLIALPLSIIGFVLACLPASLAIGWVLLAIAFVVGVVGALQSGKTRRGSVAAIAVSVLGVVVSSAIVLFTVSNLFVDLFANLFEYIFNNGGRHGG